MDLQCKNYTDQLRTIYTLDVTSLLEVPELQ